MLSFILRLALRMYHNGLSLITWQSQETMEVMFERTKSSSLTYRTTQKTLVLHMEL